MDLTIDHHLPVAVLDAVPNPILVKDDETRYVWVNKAFERLFGVDRAELVGECDADVFQDRQAAQCNGGDLRVLASGEVDEALETVIDPDLGPRETITRKSRLTIGGQHYLVGVMHDISEVSEKNRQLTEASAVLERQAVELQRLASTDPLTGCANRRELLDRAAELVHADRVGVIALDLDRFKAINDTHGHDGGDAVLVQFVETVRAQLRPSDVLGRLVGEEFLVILPDTSAEQVEVIAERLRAGTVATPAQHSGARILHSVSVGVVHTGADEIVAIDELFALADSRLYEAKRQGRDRVVAH